MGKKGVEEKTGELYIYVYIFRDCLYLYIYPSQGSLPPKFFSSFSSFFLLSENLALVENSIGFFIRKKFLNRFFSCKKNEC